MTTQQLLDVYGRLAPDVAVTLPAFLLQDVLKQAVRAESYKAAAEHQAQLLAEIPREGPVVTERPDHHPDCDVNDINPDGIEKPCNCKGVGTAATPRP